MKTTHRYDDIIHRERPISNRAPMSLIDRAAQFMPFAALTGYESVIQETGRQTQQFVELTEGEQAVLNERLHELQQRIQEGPEATFCVFFLDTRKEGGSYREITGRVKKIDVHTQTVYLEDIQLPMKHILSISM